MQPFIESTYSPEDDKLRLRAASRLPADLYERVRAAGFTWAPKQELFVAHWSPEREDVAAALATSGEIEPEETSRADRAEDRAARFAGYSAKRAGEATSAASAVHRIMDGIPLGQPILVGHHSERRARRDAERIKAGIAKAASLQRTAEWWATRARSLLAHVDRMERPDVRARRIRTMEAALRKSRKTADEARALIKIWDNLGRPSPKTGEPCTPAMDLKRALFIANNFDHLSHSFPLADYPRSPPASQYEGPVSLWSALGGNIDGADPETVAIITPEEARDLAVQNHERNIATAERWIAHLEGRLGYERAALAETHPDSAAANGKPEPRRKSGKAALPLVNIPDGVESVTVVNRYSHRGETNTYPVVNMTAPDYAKVPPDYKGTDATPEGARVRVAMQPVGSASRMAVVRIVKEARP